MPLSDLTPLIEVGLALNVAYVGLDRARDKRDDKIMTMKADAMADIDKLCCGHGKDSDYQRLNKFPDVLDCTSKSIWVNKYGRSFYKFLYDSAMPEYIASGLGLVLLVIMTLAGFNGVGIAIPFSVAVGHLYLWVILFCMWIPVVFLMIWYRLYRCAKSSIQEWSRNLLKNYKKNIEDDLNLVAKS